MTEETKIDPTKVVDNTPETPDKVYKPQTRENMEQKDARLSSLLNKFLDEPATATVPEVKQEEIKKETVTQVQEPATKATELVKEKVVEPSPAEVEALKKSIEALKKDYELTIKASLPKAQDQEARLKFIEEEVIAQRVAQRVAPMEQALAEVEQTYQLSPVQRLQFFEFLKTNRVATPEGIKMVAKGYFPAPVKAQPVQPTTPTSVRTTIPAKLPVENVNLKDDISRRKHFERVLDAHAYK